MSKDRSSRRFWISEPLPARFDGMPVTVWDIAEKGVQIEHTEALPAGSSGFLSYTIPGRQKAIEIHGQVRWTRPVEGQQHVYRSGVLVDGGSEVLNASIDLLIKKGLARLDPPERTTTAPATGAGAAASSGGDYRLEPSSFDPSQKTIAMVEEARERLAVSFDVAVKWYNRARFSLADPSVQRQVQDIRCKEDVLAVWEFLGRSVDIHVIARVFERR